MDSKIIELENRVKELELYVKKTKRNKAIVFVITLIFVAVLAVLYIYLISKVFNNYITSF